jgi:hypothetical protein
MRNRRPFELEWLGGPAERHFRRGRPGIDDLPWDTLRPGDYPPELVDRARVSWTEGAFNEYSTAAAFTYLLRCMLEANAPIDLVGMAGEFIADEMLHVELNARLAMELGGGAPYLVDFDNLTPRLDADLDATQRTNELMIRICCVGETFSIPMLSGSMRAATHPLTHAVLQRIVQDEAPHGRLGWLWLEHIGPSLDDVERARLARVATDSLRQFESFWKLPASTASNGVTSEGFQLAHVHDLGWMEAQHYASEARTAVSDKIVAPLAHYGIELDAAQVTQLLA